MLKYCNFSKNILYPGYFSKNSGIFESTNCRIWLYSHLSKNIFIVYKQSFLNSEGSKERLNVYELPEYDIFISLDEQPKSR